MANPAGLAVLSITGLLAVVFYMSHDETQTADIKSRQAELRCDAARFDLKAARSDRLTPKDELTEVADRVAGECGTFTATRTAQAEAEKKKQETASKLQESLEGLTK